MKAFLLHRDKDFDWDHKQTVQDKILIRDLELELLFQTMGNNNKIIYESSKQVVMQPLYTVGEIRYRQEILKEMIEKKPIVLQLQNLCDTVFQKVKDNTRWYYSSDRPTSRVQHSVEILQIIMNELKRLRFFADQEENNFQSEGIVNFWKRIKEELSESYFQEMEEHLKKCRFRNGILLFTHLDDGNRAQEYILSQPNIDNRNWFLRMFKKKEGCGFYIADRDENGAKALSELEEKGMDGIGNTLAQAVDHILSFFQMLNKELAFYFGCMNLYEQMRSYGEPVVFPDVYPVGEKRFKFQDLYYVCLTITKKEKVVSNDGVLEQKSLIVVTGANQGGKSTYLRSLILAQVMMQCGMFVGAQYYDGSIVTGIYTHFRKEEDERMNSGKLDEELVRMNEIISEIHTGARIYFNESFAATNEREGSEIANQITRALIESGVDVIYVTHFYEYAECFYENKNSSYLFLQAERTENGERNFKVKEGKPTQTGFGEDIYNNVFKEK